MKFQLFRFLRLAVGLVVVVLASGVEAVAAAQYCATLLAGPTEQIGGRILPIVEVRGKVPYVEFRSKLVAASPETIQQYRSEIMLSDARVAPGWVTASNVKMEQSGTSFINVAGGPFNKELLFSVELESPVALDHCWIGLGITSDRGGSGNLLQEIGSLHPYTPKTVTIHRQLAVELGAGKYSWHVFSRDREILHTLMRREYVDKELRSNVARARSRVMNAEAEPYLTFPPRGDFAAGSRVTLTLKIADDGAVTKASVVAGVNPLADRALLTVARQWWFLPKVVGARNTSTALTVVVDLSSGNLWSNAAVQRVLGAEK